MSEGRTCRRRRHAQRVRRRCPGRGRQDRCGGRRAARRRGDRCPRADSHGGVRGRACAYRVGHDPSARLRGSGAAARHHRARHRPARGCECGGRERARGISRPRRRFARGCLYGAAVERPRHSSRHQRSGEVPRGGHASVHVPPRCGGARGSHVLLRRGGGRKGDRGQDRARESRGESRGRTYGGNARGAYGRLCRGGRAEQPRMHERRGAPQAVPRRHEHIYPRGERRA